MDQDLSKWLWSQFGPLEFGWSLGLALKCRQKWVYKYRLLLKDSPSEEDLALYFTSPDPIIRKYAEYKIKGEKH